MPTTKFTTITALPAGVSRETVLETFRQHTEMIDLAPTHHERHRIAPPPEATAEEYHCVWYSITDKISYFPGYKGSVSFKAYFHDLPLGLETRSFAPMGLDIKQKWTIAGNAPGEPIQPAEIGIGAPVSGLYIREDVEMKCNFLMMKFVRKSLKDNLATLVARLLVKSQLIEAAETNRRLDQGMGYNHEGYSPMGSPQSPPLSMTPPMSPGLPMYNKPQRLSTMSAYTAASEMDGGFQSSQMPDRRYSRPGRPIDPVELPS
jgi:hypothetical protein